MLQKHAKNRPPCMSPVQILKDGVVPSDAQHTQIPIKWCTNASGKVQTDWQTDRWTDTPSDAGCIEYHHRKFIITGSVYVTSWLSTTSWLQFMYLFRVKYHKCTQRKKTELTWPHPEAVLENGATLEDGPFFPLRNHDYIAGIERLLMEIPGNQPIFCLWPIQKLLHLGIPNRV